MLLMISAFGSGCDALGYNIWTGEILEQTEDLEELTSEDAVESEVKEESVSSEQDAVIELELPVLPSVTEDDLIILKDPGFYSYDNLENDIQILQQLYGELVSVSSLATTLDGRNVYCMVIGDPQADTKLFFNGGIHGREYMTCQLVMKQAAVFLHKLYENDVYSQMDYQTMMNGVAIYVVPMINPDGVTISQYGMDGILKESTKQRVAEVASLDGEVAKNGYYLTRWKANANGVDINRNFDALWESYEGVGHPSSDHYKGESIGCEPESEALIKLTEENTFDRTISYHTQGSVIYWYFGQEGELYDKTLEFANCISNLTGYPTDANYEYLDPAGYKDWGIHKLGIPGLTVEIGTETSPVPADQFAGIWERNQFVWEETICNVK